MAQEVVRVQVDGLEGGPVLEEASTAEWNTLLPHGAFTGRLLSAGGEASAKGHIALLLAPEDGDFASATAEAAVGGACAVLFGAERGEPRPFGYRHDQTPPGVPAGMLGRSLAGRVREALEAGLHLEAQISLITRVEDEDVDDAEQGLVSGFIAEDAVDDELHSRLTALRTERDRCERSLRFAQQMRALLEQNQAHCPICFIGGGEGEAFAVMPECFHVLCRACLDRQSLSQSSLACPMCRVQVSRLDVVIFRAPGASQEAPPQLLGGEADGEADGEAGGEAGSEVAGEVGGEAGGDTGSEAGGKADGEVGGEADSRAAGEVGCEVGDDAAGEVAIALAAARAEEAPDAVAEAWEALPSKLQHLLGLLREILASGAEERVLVFTQWAAHVDHLREELGRQGVQTLALIGELSETMDALSRFGRQGEARVLLLSSQRHSSGINLQVARHVVIVHPYCTPTASSQDSISRAQMLAYEAQAIGRVRRYPQRRPVHIYRLFASGSIEESLYAGR